MTFSPSWGSCYSPTRGLDPLVRNLLANPSIRRLVILGNDFTGSGKALGDLFEHGFSRGATTLGLACWLVKSDVEACIDLEVDAAAIEAMRADVTVHRSDADSLRALLSGLAAAPALPPARKRLVFDKTQHKPPVLPAADVVRVIRGARVADTWLEILAAVMTFGRESATHYGSRQKEIIDLVSVVESEDPEKPYVPEYLSCTEKDLEEYFPKVLTDRAYPDTAYTYGQRLRVHFGVDQLESIIAKLAADPDTRSATAVLWDSASDNKGHGAPCINHIWARLRDDKVYLTATIRSNDMYSAWPENAFALRKLQSMIAAEVSRRSGRALALGELVTLSESAHIYGDCWADAARVVDQYRLREVAAPESRQDPAGSFVISVADGAIICEHISPSGEHIDTYTGHTAAHIAGLVTRAGVITSVAHGVYVGRELARAETALANSDIFCYVQDQQLKRKREGK